MTKLLLEKSATINAFDKKDRRAVHWADHIMLYRIHLTISGIGTHNVNA
jgi:hypothetical protein